MVGQYLPAAGPKDANASPLAPDTGISRPAAWPRQRRLLSRSEFREVYERGVRVTSRHFTVFGLPRQDSGPAGARYGITVSRKLGKSVVRNRIRRRTREILRRLSGGQRACNIVINPRPSVAQAGFVPLAEELVEQLRRLETVMTRKFARSVDASCD